MCLQSGERSMHRRPAALTMPEPGQQSRGPQLSFARQPHIPARSSLPEVFTFDVEELPTVSPAKPPRRHHTKRPRRVLYPSQRRRNRYMPPEERNPALRWLYVLCLVVCVQVCLEEGDEAHLSSQGPPTTLHGLASDLQDQLLQGPAAAMKEHLQMPESMPEHASFLQGSLSVLQEAPALHQTQQEQASQPHNLTCHPLGRLLLTF
ncbi:hypothetical protein NDU88_011767 [Pleurodeles waltl]|uniref:Radiation-inducible immediate-early gene IEX-1 n=1 Tax=Pleurodeles waltl TaxID=8319 RepID=A0AAV7R2B5_PLEWA|nr:hypothetical protein NDU88_011767 [Pleurodeles waltl]